MLESDNNAIPILPFCLEGYRTKYALKDPLGNLIEQYHYQTLNRVGEALTQGPYSKYKDIIFRALSRGGVPAGRILANAGSPYKRASLINCTVSRGIEDSMEGIFTAVKEAAMTLSSGSGIGYCFSTLRPKNAPVSGVGAFSSGPISFMKVFDSTCRTVFAGGGRRGAQMGTFWVYHPDIFDFVTAKKEEGALRNMNLSVMVDEEFMERVKNDENVDLVFPELSNDPPGSIYVERHFPGVCKYKEKTKVRIYKTIRAREIWDAIMRNTYDNSEPGVLFYDRMNDMNPLNFAESLFATNPCGEQVLPPFGACNLGSMNLTSYLETVSDGYRFDFNAFREDVYAMHILLDAVCDQAQLALPQQTEEILSKRRHGLGIMGLGSTLALMGLPYDVAYYGNLGVLPDYYGKWNAEIMSMSFCEEIGKVLVNEGLRANIELAKNIKSDVSIFNDKKNVERFFDTHYWKYLAWLGYVDRSLIDEAMKTGLRFSHATAIAPTGTIALYMGNNVSNGIEPTFRHEYIRNVKVANRKTLKDTLVSSYEIRRFRHDFPDKKIPDSFKESHEISPRQHIEMQGLFQKFMDSSISKTINVPSSLSYEEFKNVYQEAYENGCKGCTTFRYNPDIFHGVLIDPKDLEKTSYVIKTKGGKEYVLNGASRLYLSDIDEETIVANLVAYLRHET